jgi:curved DNA-binding protein CbpA
MSTEPDAYEVLYLRPDAPAELISLAYRALARRYHPDGPTPDAVRMTKVNRAYNELKTEALRRRYDEARARARAEAETAAGPATPGAAPAPPAPASSGAGDPARRFRATRAGGYAAAKPTSGAAAGDQVVDFGRYAGWRIADLARHDPEYLRWLSRHASGVRFREAIARAMPGDPELGRRTGFSPRSGR